MKQYFRLKNNTCEYVVQATDNSIQTKKVAPIYSTDSRFTKNERTFYNLMKIKKNNYVKHMELDVPINFFITDHCNLNCKSCCVFSPLAEKSFMSLNVFERDIKQLAKLSDSNVKEIYILGGEPLLHPQCIDFCIVARKYLPNTIIKLITNGIRLSRQSKNFFSKLKENSIIVLITKYPINVNYNEIEKLLISSGNEYYFLDKPSSWKKIPLVENKISNPCKVFTKCYQNNECLCLHDGYFYPCHVGNRVKILNKKFNKKYPFEHNGINIHDCKSLDELLTFLSNPIPLCSYCGVCEIQEIEWTRSERNIEEWLLISNGK